MPRPKRIQWQGWQDGTYWIHLLPGYRSIATETHSICESTKTEALRGMSMVEPCDCPECKEIEELKTK